MGTTVGQIYFLRYRQSSLFALHHLLQIQFPLLCKAVSFEDVSDVVNVALNGVVMKPPAYVSAAITLRLENQ